MDVIGKIKKAIILSRRWKYMWKYNSDWTPVAEDGTLTAALFDTRFEIDRVFKTKNGRIRFVKYPDSTPGKVAVFRSNNYARPWQYTFEELTHAEVEKKYGYKIKRNK